MNNVLEAETFKKLQPVEYQRRFMAKDIRPDGRKLNEARGIKIQPNPLNRTQGSSTVKIGDTIVICGIKAEIAEPLATEPRKGYFVPNIDLPALCSSKFKPGPPGEQTQSVSEVIDELFKKVSIINLEELCIEPNKAVWVLYADMVCLNHDGSILDACLVSLMTALKKLRLPKVELGDGIAKALGPSNILLTLNRVVFSCSFCLFDSNVLLDPTEDEEAVSTSTFSILIDNNGQCCGQLKGGGEAITKLQLDTCIQMSKKRAAETLALI